MSIQPTYEVGSTPNRHWFNVITPTLSTYDAESMLIQLCVPTEVLPIVFSFFLLFMECIGIRNIIIQVNDQSVRNVSWRVSHGMCDQGRPQTASTPARSEQAYIFAYSVDESKQNNKKKADQPSQVSRLPLVLPARTPHMASSCVYICRQM